MPARVVELARNDFQQTSYRPLQRDTHPRKQQGHHKHKLRRKDDQEVYGRVLNDCVEKAWHLEAIERATLGEKDNREKSQKVCHCISVSREILQERQTITKRYRCVRELHPPVPVAKSKCRNVDRHFVSNNQVNQCSKSPLEGQSPAEGSYMECSPPKLLGICPMQAERPL